MNTSILQSEYKRWFLLGLVVQLIACYFSGGYHHMDEHFQILEFCNYKMGYSPASDLPWEFFAQCRPAVQPGIAFVFAKTLEAIGLYDPFLLTFLLRLLVGIFSWWAACRLILRLLPEFHTEAGKKIFVWSSMLLWFIPYLGARFSAENVSAILLLLSLSFIIDLSNKNVERRIPMLIITGLLLGFCMFVRLQTIFAIAGLGIWMLFIKKWRWAELVLLIFFAAVAIGLNVAIDYWFYGNWVFSPYNYYYQNMVLHKASGFGTSPWWWYFTKFLETGVPPISIVLLLLFIYGVIKKPLHLLSIISILFIVGHSAVGHKELRFLFPIVIPFIFLASSGLDHLVVHYAGRYKIKWAFNILVTINTLLLLYRITAPAQESARYYSYIYHKIDRQPLVSYGYDIYIPGGDPNHPKRLKLNFYVPPNLDLILLEKPEDIAQVAAQRRGKQLYYIDRYIVPKAPLPGYRMEQVYCLIPKFVQQFNINNWVTRSNIWMIAKLEPTSETN